MKKIDFNSAFTFKEESLFIRPIQFNDIQILRKWKNHYRYSFHYQEIISPTEQEAWFDRFVKDPHQQIFILKNADKPLACIGYRQTTPHKFELFNLICGDETKQGTGLITAFFEETKHALKNHGVQEIHLEVLKNNTHGIAWYLKQNFQIVVEKKTFLNMSLTL